LLKSAALLIIALMLVTFPATDLYYFSPRYCTTYSNCTFITSPPTSSLTYLQKWQQVLLNGVDGWSVVVSTKRISRIVVKQTNSNWGTFNVINIINTLRNYFTCELLPDNVSSESHFTELFP